MTIELHGQVLLRNSQLANCQPSYCNTRETTCIVGLGASWSVVGIGKGPVQGNDTNGGSGNEVDLAPSMSGAATNPGIKSPQQSTQICQPPTMMECGLRAGGCTSIVQINSGRFGMWAMDKGCTSTVEMNSSSQDLGLWRRTCPKIVIFKPFRSPSLSSPSLSPSLSVLVSCLPFHSPVGCFLKLLCVSP